MDRSDPKRIERAVMADHNRPCLYGVAGPCQHPNCLEAHFLTLSVAPPPPAEQASGELVQIGAYGSAFDPPNTCRAFTYEHQPGNVLASRLGGAADRAAHMSAGDSIDRGLCLLYALQEAGFGVYQLAGQQPTMGEG